MSPIQKVVVAILMGWARHGLGLLTAYLVTKHVITAPDGDAFSKDIVGHLQMWLPLVIALAWSALAKYWAQKKVSTALQMKAGSAEHSMIDLILEGFGASLRGAK